MKLKAVVKSLDGLSEEIAKLYEKKGDVFVLSIDGVVDHPDVTNLSKTMKTVRTEGKEFEKKFKALTDKIAGLDIDKLKDVDLDEYQKSITELETLKLEQNKREKQKLKDEKQWEKLETRLKDQHKTDLEGLTSTHSSEKDALLEQLRTTTETKDKSNTDMLSTLKIHLKDKEITAQLAKERGNIPILMPHISPFVDVRATKDGDYSALVIDEKKNPRFNNSGKPMSIEELVLEFKEKPEFSGEGIFEVEKKAGGSGSQGNRGDDFTQNNPFAKDTRNLTQQAILKTTDPQLFDKLKDAAKKEE